MSNSPIIDTLLQFAGQPQVLTIQKAFIRFTGSIDSALMLSQLLFWTPAAEDHVGRNKGWIWRSDKEWGESIYLTQYAIRAARKRLEEMGVVETDVRKANGNPTVHYHVLMGPLNDLWQTFVAHPESENPSFDFADWFLRIRKNDIADSQEPSSGFARTLTVEISSRDQQITPAVADTPADPLVDNAPIQQTIGFIVDEPEAEPKAKSKKEPRATRAKTPPSYAEAVRGIYDSLPIKYPHAFIAKAAKLVCEVVEQNGWPSEEVAADLGAAYASMQDDPFWSDKEINPMILAKRYMYWRGRMKAKQESHVGATTPYQVEPLFAKRQE